VNVIQEAFERSSQKSMESASAELHIPQSTVHKIIKVKQHEHAYKIQVVQMLQEDDYHARMDLCQQIILNITGSYYILEELTFSDEATSHISGKFNGNRWDREKPRDVWQHERDSPKLNMWCALRKSCNNGPFFLKDATVNSEFYPALLQGFLIPELRQLNLLRPNLLSAKRCPLPLCFECATVTE
jgi:hypothetical protein